ncbi:hypothetical protein SUGI_0205210 [Cryptomeria japonica]|nr:hypothetical protein SUGI_0205210 [Cryptomeria japonica]
MQKLQRIENKLYRNKFRWRNEEWRRSRSLRVLVGGNPIRTPFFLLCVSQGWRFAQVLGGVWGVCPWVWVRRVVRDALAPLFLFSFFYGRLLPAGASCSSGSSSWWAGDSRLGGSRGVFFGVAWCRLFFRS